MNDYTKVPEVMISAEEIAQRVKEMGEAIARDLDERDLTVVGVLKGSFVFMADLVRAIERPLTCDFLGLSSYGSATESSGVVAITKDLGDPVENKHVLVIEDIIDTGLTMAYLLENLATRRPASVKIASLLSKPARRRVEIDIDYLGFTIEDRFVVGYGLDFDGRYRNLPYIGTMD
ncbi:MAG: hypoxanthine phosphoribosyltransferase [Myxococcales bacterium]|nr:hypoxanthine phosphoribosyltransferase [Myxococcales bacterium]MCB9645480.1 hypoxanthine phosphoribosyltransferase [Deltaproteobacteria bacterium]